MIKSLCTRVKLICNGIIIPVLKTFCHFHFHILQQYKKHYNSLARRCKYTEGVVHIAIYFDVTISGSMNLSHPYVTPKAFRFCILHASNRKLEMGRSTSNSPTHIHISDGDRPGSAHLLTLNGVAHLV